MYEKISNLTSMFFKSSKGNLMYEFLISKFNGKRGPQKKLSLEQIVMLNIYRFHFKNGGLKNYLKIIKGSISSFLILNSGKDCKGWRSQFRSVAKE